MFLHVSVMKQKLVTKIAFSGGLKPLLSKQHVAMVGINKVRFLSMKLHCICFSHFNTCSIVV